MFSHVSVHPSICLSHMGGTPARSGGTPPGQGIPHLGYPPITPGLGGTPARGTPPWVPPVTPDWGYPCQWGVPHLGYPHQTWPGRFPSSGILPIRPGPWGYPCQGGTPPRVTDGVLDTPQSVCLLRLHRRTFLTLYSFRYMWCF